MTVTMPTAAAAALHATRQRAAAGAPLPPAIAPRTEAEGAAAQRALARQLGADPPAASRSAPPRAGCRSISACPARPPASCRLPACTRSGAVLRFADFVNPGVECEIAVRLARDLPPGPCTAEAAAAAVGEFFAAIEIVENRYGDLADLGTPTLIADQVFHAAAVLGAATGPGGPATGATLDVADACAAAWRSTGWSGDRGEAADLLGHPLNWLAWLAGSSVAAAFGGLRAGQVVLLGSVTPPVWLDAPGTVTVEFPPLPPVQVTFA